MPPAPLPLIHRDPLYVLMVGETWRHLLSIFYVHSFMSIDRILKEEGLFTLWRGAIPTMGRAMVVNAAQLASYSQAKQFILIVGKLLQM